MSQSHSINAEPVQYTLCTRVFGGIDTPDLKRKIEVSKKDLGATIERLFLNNAAATAAIVRGGIADMAARFVTFSETQSDIQRWELSAGITLVTPESLEHGQAGVVEADFQSLVRDFGACFAIPLLYGKDFLDHSPALLDDFWRFDNELFPLLVIGMPRWLPLKMMKEGLASQSRLLDAIEAFYRRVDKIQHDEPVDADMSDVGDIPLGRNRVYEQEKWTFKQRAAGDLAILWGQNANTQPVLFWLLLYIYSTPGLLEILRNEIAPYVGRSTTKDAITSMDFVGLFHSCHLLKSCIFETYRLSVDATSIRYVEQPLVVADGEYTHNLRPGMFISAPHALSQHDPSVYHDPEKFIPDRFLVRDASGQASARYGKLRPWGAGTGICKGRSFAEKEIMALGAAIVMLWDVRPASGKWEVPAMIPGTGAKKPVRDVRILITRRQGQ